MTYMGAVRVCVAINKQKKSKKMCSIIIFCEAEFLSSTMDTISHYVSTKKYQTSSAARPTTSDYYILLFVILTS